MLRCCSPVDDEVMKDLGKFTRLHVSAVRNREDGSNNMSELFGVLQVVAWRQVAPPVQSTMFVWSCWPHDWTVRAGWPGAVDDPEIVSSL